MQSAFCRLDNKQFDTKVWSPKDPSPQLNRPEKSNAFGHELWRDFARVGSIQTCMAALRHEILPCMQAVKALEASASTHGTRAIVVTGAGRNFCAGIDVIYLQAMFKDLEKDTTCPGRMRDKLRRNILSMQETFSCLEACSLPVVAAVHGAVSIISPLSLPSLRHIS